MFIFSGNPIAVAAGLATLKILDSEIYAKLEVLAARLEAGIMENLAKLSLPYHFQRVGSMCCLFFTDQPVTNYQQAAGADARLFAAYFQAMLDRRIYLPPSQFETFFISASHTNDDIDRTIEANLNALQKIT